MSTSLSTRALDQILALQLTVAWAGEGHGEPPELGWWATSLTDPEGGANFLERMFPRTHVWAALGGMREAARRTDERARGKTAKPDALITLYHFGFEWDEALRERFDQHKRSLVAPADVLGSTYAIRPTFDRAAFEKYLAGLAGKVAHEIVPGGRQLPGPLPPPDTAAVRLAAALLPLTPEYPLPFYVKSERA
jgi:hypothetical protein